jgi:hypothetical protein
MTSAANIRFYALASAHQHLADLYSQLFSEVSDRQKFDIERELTKTHQLIKDLRGGFSGK